MSVSERHLSSAPAMLPLFLRAGATMIPGAARLPFLSSVAAKPGPGAPVPDTALILDDAAVDRERLAAYDRVCGFDLSDTLPVTYPHVLAFGLQMTLLTATDFPLTPIGLVHIANRIEQHRSIAAAELLQVRVWATPLYPHPRGLQFMLRTEVRVGAELVWEEASTMLSRGRAEESASAPPAPPSSADLPANASWRLAGDLGRRYGAVSGDLNPIHVHPLTARLLGFERPIVHGMWTEARCLAALGPELPGRLTVEVAFKRPVLLPATVAFAESAIEGGIAFGVRDARDGTPHLDGQVDW